MESVFIDHEVFVCDHRSEAQVCSLYTAQYTSVPHLPTHTLTRWWAIASGALVLFPITLLSSNASTKSPYMGEGGGGGGRGARRRFMDTELAKDLLTQYGKGRQRTADVWAHYLLLCSSCGQNFQLGSGERT